MYSLLPALLGAFLCAAATAGEEVASVDGSGIQVTYVSRTVDLSSQVVKETLTVTVERAAASGPTNFFFAFEPKKWERLAYFEVTTSDGNVLGTAQVDVKQKRNFNFLKVELPSSARVRLNVQASYTHMLTAYPTHIRQNERQLMIFQDSHYALLPYAVKKQKLVVKLFSEGVPESYSKRVQPVEKSGRTITYGPYNDVPAFGKELLRIHFETNAPFLAVTKQRRLIEVSHWGNIAVEENLEVRHAGAVLKGSFSRLDYQHDLRESAPSIARFLMLLPPFAKDVYYRDEIGNITTSAMKYMSDAVQLFIQPRFPLFGGWKTTFTIGYNVDSKDYLSSSGDWFCLKMKLIDHLFDNFVTDDFQLTIILPEMSSDFDLKTPYDVQQEPMERRYTYLDTVGRPTLVLRKKNLVMEHMQDFKLCYRWKRWQIVREPFMVVLALFVLFSTIIVSVRLDFSFYKNSAEEGKVKVDGLMDKISELHNQRTGAYSQWMDAIEKYSIAKDAGAFAAARKKADQVARACTQQITALQAQFKPIGGDAVEKVAAVQRADKVVRDTIAVWQQEVERYVAGKISRQVYQEKAAGLHSKIGENIEKHAQLLYCL